MNKTFLHHPPLLTQCCQYWWLRVKYHRHVLSYSARVSDDQMVVSDAHFICKESKDGMNEKIVFALLFLYVLFETAVLEMYIWQKGRFCLRGTVPYLYLFLNTFTKTELNFNLQLTSFSYLWYSCVKLRTEPSTVLLKFASYRYTYSNMGFHLVIYIKFRNSSLVSKIFVFSFFKYRRKGFNIEETQVELWWLLCSLKFFLGISERLCWWREVSFKMKVRLSVF